MNSISQSAELKYPEDFGKEKIVYTINLINEYNSLVPDLGEYVHSCEFVNGFKKESYYQPSYSAERLDRKQEIVIILKGLWNLTLNS